MASLKAAVIKSGLDHEAAAQQNPMEPGTVAPRGDAVEIGPLEFGVVEIGIIQGGLSQIAP